MNGQDHPKESARSPSFARECVSGGTGRTLRKDHLPGYLDGGGNLLHCATEEKSRTAMSDETALIDAWEQDGIACREIRSHRAPSRHTGLKVAACAVAAGMMLGLESVMLGGTEVIQGNARSFRVETYVPSVNRAPEKVSRGIARTPFDERLTASRTTVRRQWVLPSSKSPVICWGDMDGDELNVGLDFPGDGKATGAGVVAEVGRDDRLGLLVIIDHQDGTMSMYSGVQRVAVRKGASVVLGQRVVTGGFQFSVSLASSVDSVTDHLVNPVPWLNERVSGDVECNEIAEKIGVDK